MPTTVTTASAGPIAANGLTPIPFAFQSISAEEIVVLRNGVVVSAEEYTVQRDDSGQGSVTPLVSWGTDNITIRSAPNYRLDVSFNRNGAFYPDQLNPVLDRITRYIIALKDGVGLNTGGTTTGSGGSFGNQLLATTSLTEAKTLMAYAKGDIGLGNVDNTSDVDKPVSTAVETALAGKLNLSQVDTFGMTLLGAATNTGAKVALELTKTDVGLGNVDNTSDAAKPVSNATQTALAGKENNIAAGTSAQYWRGDKIWATLNKSAVGLANVDNTSDASKPISSATQTALNDKVNTSAVGAVSGVAPLGTDGKVPAAYLPSTETSGGTGGVESVNGYTGIVNIGKADVGLGSADNTSDAAKPVSTAQQTALNGKENSITAGTTAQYWRGDKVWATLDKGTVGLSAVDNTSDADKPVSTAQQTALNAKLNSSAAEAFGLTLLGSTTLAAAKNSLAYVKADIGLSSVDNTSDAAKPVSTATQTALDAKAPKTNPVFTGDVYCDSDDTPGYFMRDTALVKQGQLYWDQGDDSVKLRRYNATGSGKEGELALFGTYMSYEGQGYFNNKLWVSGADAPGLMIRNASSVKQGQLYWDQADDSIRLRRYNAAGSAAEGELVMSATELRFNGNLVGGGSSTTAYTDEQVRDVMAAAIAAGTHSGISITHDDAADKFSFAVTGGTTSAHIDPGASNGTNDELALTNAATSAAGGAGIVNGRGRTYRIDGELVIADLSGVTFENCHFVQASATSGIYKMFHVRNGNGWVFRHCIFEVGTSTMGGYGAMDNAYGLLIEDGKGHHVTDCEFFGYGKGTALGMKYVRDSFITRPYIHDLQYNDTTVNNDTLEGLDLLFCANITVDSPRIRNFRGNGVNVNNRMTNSDFIAIQHTRGVSISGSNDITINSPNISLVGQGIDVSGDEGNWNVNINNGRYKMCALFAEKFANSAARCKSEGALIDRVGYAGIVCSGVDAAMATTKSTTHTTSNPDLVSAIVSTRNITINSPTCFSPGFGVDPARFGQRAGVLILDGTSSTDAALMPHGIRVNNAVVIDDDGGSTHGVFSDPITNTGNPNNEFNTQVENVPTRAAGFHNDFT